MRALNGATFRIGIDVGGTKIEGLALSRDGAEAARKRIETPKDYERTLLAIEGLISFLEEEASAASGDADATVTYGRYVDRLARGLASVINVFDPEVVVLGGGMSNLPALAEDVQAALPPHVFTDHLATRVLSNVHGDSSGVRGAAWLWPVDDLGAAPKEDRH